MCINYQGNIFVPYLFQDETYDEFILDFSPDASSGIAMEGYLYKRASNAFKTWSRYNTILFPSVHLYLLPIYMSNSCNIWAPVIEVYKWFQCCNLYIFLVAPKWQNRKPSFCHSDNIMYSLQWCKSIMGICELIYMVVGELHCSQSILSPPWRCSSSAGFTCLLGST